MVARAKRVKVSSRRWGVSSPWTNSVSGRVAGTRWGGGGRELAQGVGQFAGEEAGVGGQVEVDQHLLQAVVGHGAQHGQVQGGGAQGLVRPLPLAVGVGCWEIDTAAQVVVGEGGHHDAVVRCPADLDRLRQRIIPDLFAVDLFVVHGVGEQVGRRAREVGGAAAGASGVGGLGQVGGGEDAGGVAVM